MTDQDPMFQRERLRDRLRKARERAGLTQREVAENLDWSPSKIIRVENGKIRVTLTDVMALLGQYGITEQDQVQEFSTLARMARKPPWYSPYREVLSSAFQAYLAYEGSASIVRNFERNVVPGLLQTEEYARGLLEGFSSAERLSTARLDMLIQLRMERQDRLIRPDRGEFFFILDESAVRRVIGSEDVMRRQYDRLLATNEMPNVNVLIVPFTAGIYPQFRTPYVVFEFPDEDDDIVAYLEGPDGEVIFSEKAPSGVGKRQPADYLDTFWKVEKGVARGITEEILHSG